MCSQIEAANRDADALPTLQKEFEGLEKRYASALELMGERDEQVEELQADLEDVKQMYREQINLLCNPDGNTH